MSGFVARRLTQRFVQRLNAPRSAVFPLLCPTREYDWIETWTGELVYSASGFAEEDCVFRTRLPREGIEEVWAVSRYEPPSRIEFVRFHPDRVIRYSIALEDNAEGTTDSTWQQTLTALTTGGNANIAKRSQVEFERQMAGLGKMLNHYLETGRMLRDSG